MRFSKWQRSPPSHRRRYSTAPGSRALGLGTSTVDWLRSKDLPAIWIGHSPRFEIAQRLAWLRARGQKQ